ncbi:MAG TPA: adenylosuccinate synthetase [Drouetiella sp.]
MKTGKVVIGANYGDEGKGLLTDYFASQDPENSVVVRFNGGAQAGHTVVVSDGRRHVFSHFSSGSFVGCPTYLSKFFVVNPIIFTKELESLRALNVTPSSFVSADAILTTPYDMFINQQVELKRGANNHGSCGLGINETVTRSFSDLSNLVQVKDILDKNKLYEKLIHLSKGWFPQRLQQLGHVELTPELANFIDKQDQILKSFIRDADNLADRSLVTNDYFNFKRVIFEGAQGLMLDEDRLDQFPHVTRSKTGLMNVLHLASKFGVERLDVTYVTRTYLTRHGAGPLEGECDWKFPDATNIPNQFQGTLRFAPLNKEILQRNIAIDLSRAKFASIDVRPNIAITCTDQMPTPNLRDSFVPVKYFSEGPTRQHVRRAILAGLR